MSLIHLIYRPPWSNRFFPWARLHIHRSMCQHISQCCLINSARQITIEALLLPRKTRELTWCMSEGQDRVICLCNGTRKQFKHFIQLRSSLKYIQVFCYLFRWCNNVCKIYGFLQFLVWNLQAMDSEQNPEFISCNSFMLITGINF